MDTLVNQVNTSLQAASLGLDKLAITSIQTIANMNNSDSNMNPVEARAIRSIKNRLFLKLIHTDFESIVFNDNRSDLFKG